MAGKRRKKYAGKDKFRLKSFLKYDMLNLFDCRRCKNDSVKNCAYHSVYPGIDCGVGIVLIQDGETGGLAGSISGGGETFWTKNKNRSAEGKIEKATKYLVIAFLVLALLLNLPVFG